MKENESYLRAISSARNELKNVLELLKKEKEYFSHFSTFHKIVDMTESLIVGSGEKIIVDCSLEDLQKKSLALLSQIATIRELYETAVQGRKGKAS